MAAFVDAGYYGSEAVSLLEKYDDDDTRTEQVTAELLAGSVSKMSLAREVLRLKQLRDELNSSTTNDLAALRERAAVLQAEIVAEQESADREVIEIAEQVAIAREELLAAVGSDVGGARTHAEDGRSDRAAEAGRDEGGIDRAEEIAASAWKAEVRFDARFTKKLLDAKQRLAETRSGVSELMMQSDLECSVANATPLEKSSGHIKNYLRTSNCRIQIICDRIDTIAPERPIHEHCLALARENAHLRMSVNEYTEGLLAETFTQLHAVPPATTTPRA